MKSVPLRIYYLKLQPKIFMFHSQKTNVQLTSSVSSRRVAVVIMKTSPQNFNRVATQQLKPVLTAIVSMLFSKKLKHRRLRLRRLGGRKTYFKEGLSFNIFSVAFAGSQPTLRGPSKKSPHDRNTVGRDISWIFHLVVHDRVEHLVFVFTGEGRLKITRVKKNVRSTKPRLLSIIVWLFSIDIEKKAPKMIE